MSDFSAAKAVYEQIARKVAEERGCRLPPVIDSPKSHARITGLCADGSLEETTTRQRREDWRAS